MKQIAVIAAGVIIVLLSLQARNYFSVRSDCRTIYTLATMVQNREDMLGHNHQGEGPLLSAEIIGHCKRYGLDISTGNK